MTERTAWRQQFYGTQTPGKNPECCGPINATREVRPRRPVSSRYHTQYIILFQWVKNFLHLIVRQEASTHFALLWSVCVSFVTLLIVSTLGDKGRLVQACT